MEAATVPQPNGFGRQSRVRDLQHHAAHILGGEEIVTGKLQVVNRAASVKEKRIAAPPGKKPMVIALGDPRFQPHRNGRVLYDFLAFIACCSGVAALRAEQRCRLASALRWRKTHSAGDVGDRITVAINF